MLEQGRETHSTILYRYAGYSLEEKNPKCRKYLDLYNPEKDDAYAEAEVMIEGDYDGNPTG
ncbi:MAG: hypothetical protein AAGC93_19025 [Cyanobacteria bacterium P01_F01_bin.53]